MAFSYLMPGSSLLSHGEAPHYHRRYGVSLLSSAWGQVGPPRYRRQANSFRYILCLFHQYCVDFLALFSHIPVYAPSHRLRRRLVLAKNPSDLTPQDTTKFVIR